jgi:O-antigen/teichoic acid export membrane protein
MIMHPTPSPSSADRTTSTGLQRLWSGTFWLALKSPLQVIIAFWSVPLIQHAIGPEANGAYVFGWGLGFVQFLLEFGMGSALQQQVSYAWTSGDRERVKRFVACGLTFYAVVSVFQMIILLAVAYFGLPLKFQGESRRLIVGVLWIQALSAPFFGLLTVTSTVLQAARRYDFLPRLDLFIVILRFTILILGLRLGVDFLAIVASQTVVLLGGMLIPALWVMVRELRFVPRFAAPAHADFAALFQIGFYIFLMQLSVVLADRVDSTILGYALPQADPGPWITVYQNVSKPFFQIRQTAWTLAYFVVPAVAGLAAARDFSGLERIKYDGTRILVGLLLPVTLLAGIYARPFLSLWVGPAYAPHAPLLRLFLVAAFPLVLSVHAQVAIGLGKVKMVSLSPLLGSLLNVPLSYILTARLGVAGVIWGTVLTTLISNMLIPGVYLFRLLQIRPSTFVTRTLGAPLAGAAFLIPVALICCAVLPEEQTEPSVISRSLPLVLSLAVSVAAFVIGYVATSSGRSDLVALVRYFRGRREARDVA